MDLDKRRCLMNLLLTWQFNYCPLVWMFPCRKLNNRIDSIHERALRLVYWDNKATLEEILHKDNSVKVRHENLQLFANEVFKVRNDLAPDIMRENVQFKNPTYKLCSDATRKIRTTYHHSHKKRKDCLETRVKRSTCLSWEPSYTRTHSSLPYIKI